MKRKTQKASKASPVYERIRQILESARTNVARSVNTTQVVANWLIGREIVEELQKGQLKAEYGKMLVQELAEHLQADFGKGYSALILWLFRRFYEEYPGLTGPGILCAPRKESRRRAQQQKLHAPRGESGCNVPCAPRAELNAGTISEAMSRKSVVGDASAMIGDVLRSQSWQPEQLHCNLSWTHYRTLLRVDKSEARAFCEIDAIKNNWAACEPERQINSGGRE